MDGAENAGRCSTSASIVMSSCLISIASSLSNQRGALIVPGMQPVGAYARWSR